MKSKPLPNNSDRRNSLNNGNYSEETPRVEADLLDTWDFIANESLEKADSFLQKIENKLKILAENPGLGRKRDELVPGLRSFLVGSYLIFYYPIKELKLSVFCMEQEIFPAFLRIL